MENKILLTGEPRAGKTTALKRIDEIKKLLILNFITSQRTKEYY